MGFLARMLVAAFGLWLASRLVPGVQIVDSGTLILAAVLLGVVNAVVRPVIAETAPPELAADGLFAHHGQMKVSITYCVR